MAIITIDGNRPIKQLTIQGESQLITDNQVYDGTQQIVEKSEIGEALEHLNDDTIDLNDTRMSGIDMRSRLHHTEISSVLALDSLVALGICPTMTLAFTRQKKRLAISESGLGRQEIVNIVGGKQERDGNIGAIDKVKGFFGMNNGGGGQ